LMAETKISMLFNLYISLNKVGNKGIHVFMIVIWA
jgi:hypothetical protein